MIKSCIYSDDLLLEGHPRTFSMLNSFWWCKLLIVIKAMEEFGPVGSFLKFKQKNKDIF